MIFKSNYANYNIDEALKFLLFVHFYKIYEFVVDAPMWLKTVTKNH